MNPDKKTSTRKSLTRERMRTTGEKTEKDTHGTAPRRLHPHTGGRGLTRARNVPVSPWHVGPKECHAPRGGRLPVSTPTEGHGFRLRFRVRVDDGDGRGLLCFACRFGKNSNVAEAAGSGAWRPVAHPHVSLAHAPCLLRLARERHGFEPSPHFIIIQRFWVIQTPSGGAVNHT
jgi:hypothetical protein